MAFLTLEEVRNKARSNKAYGLESRDILEEQFDSFNINKTYDIFLSHAFLDAEVIYGLKITLEEAGFTVYVDWYEDSHLERGEVTKETAVVIRKRMQSCKTLIFAITQNSGDSKWMLWELGYFDGLKDKVAILGLIENSGDSFRGQEFLELYPYVQRYGSIFVLDDPFELLELWIKR
ncbi:MULTISPECIES: TIR domain-containing protein [Psychrobacter]|uniref:TIR domain-containing protein n=1 Tax=Psychrobacter TaxID=497 RepID=UPI00186698B8|nr:MULTISPECIES: TIR domain-containing protein [Psychrobacter]